MPGVDFEIVRTSIPIAQVLELVGLEACALGQSTARKLPSAPLEFNQLADFFGKPRHKSFSMFQVRSGRRSIGVVGPFPRHLDF